MTKLFRALSIAAILFTASSATAQEKKEVKVGLGVGITGFDLIPALTGTAGRAAFFVPINFGALKVEPEFGWWSFDEEGGDYSRLASVGTGVFFVLKPAPTSLYAGGRLTYTWSTQSPAGQPDVKGTDWRLVAVGGGEHFVVPTFSVGAEAQFGALNMGERRQSGVMHDPAATSWQAAGVVFLRFYVN
jgi:hypothetical protein